jgi:putative serine protease PepD
VIPDGAAVGDVTAGSAADDAGLQAGDVITKVDDQLVTSSDGLVATVRAHRPGDEVTLTYERDGDSRTTTIKLGSDADSAS